uniref:Transmembrane protein n=1 Tax=Chenopodium quinoa TaxID=63459 RepID=A0A803KVC0_CHEQI
MSMEVPPNSISLSSWDYLLLFFLRPFFALLFVLSVLCLGWWMAWKLVLVHVPLVQEIFGLRKKSSKPKNPERRYSQFYKSRDSSANPPP